MKAVLGLIVCMLVAPQLIAQRLQFSELDKNGDGVLSESEFENTNGDAFDQADQDIDRCLTEDEYAAYHKFLKKVADERSNLSEDIKVYRDLPYVMNGHYRQCLDVYLPKMKKGDGNLPLVIWIHGGGWRRGSKESVARQLYLLDHGFAVASINYRLSHHAKFPAQIHDCKAAIRYLKKNAKKFGFDKNRIGIWGSSAGGHLVALVGTSGDVKSLEGKLGVTGISSNIHAVCDWFGPADFTEMVNRPPNPNIKSTDPLMQPIPRLLGGLVADNMKLAKQASPVTYISKDDPPFLIMHGDKDPLVPHRQSELLHKKLSQVGVESNLVIIPGAGHGFFKKPEELALVTAFFEKQLKR